MPPATAWQPYLPIAIIVVIILLRMRRINRARRMHLGRLLVSPIILGALGAELFFSVTPDATGWAIFAGGLTAGAALGG